MANIVLLDASAIVALLRADDSAHAWARNTVAVLERVRLLTCEPVLAEAAYILRKLPGASMRVIDFVAEGKVDVPFRLEAEAVSVRTLMNRYRSVPMSLADACLVRMTELEPRASVMTLDSDFRIYRRSGRMTIPLITPQ